MHAYAENVNIPTHAHTHIHTHTHTYIQTSIEANDCHGKCIPQGLSKSQLTTTLSKQSSP